VATTIVASGMPTIAASSVLGHEDPEARRSTGGPTAEEPDHRLHKADRGRGMGAQASHHSGIDVLHQGGGEL
jgi:hypothetical protein